MDRVLVDGERDCDCDRSGLDERIKGLWIDIIVERVLQVCRLYLFELGEGGDDGQTGWRSDSYSYGVVGVSLLVIVVSCLQLSSSDFALNKQILMFTILVVNMCDWVTDC